MNTRNNRIFIRTGLAAMMAILAWKIGAQWHEVPDPPVMPNKLDTRILSKQPAAEAFNHLDSAFPFQAGRLWKKGPSYFGRGKDCNLLVVQLESVQNFTLNLSVNGKQVTPVMNKLVKESLYFSRVFQQIGAGNTSDAEFIVNTSLYPRGAKATSEICGNKEFPSLARLLQRKGYTAHTFHVNDVSFWDRNLMYPALGFNSYYDQPYFRREIFNRFGPSDEELYRVGINKVKNFTRHKKKWYAQFITVSGHAPFAIPAGSRKLTLPQNLAKRELGKYLTAVNYSDYALGRLIDSLKSAGLWDQTVLVVYGDHFGLSKKKHHPAEITKLLGIPYHKQISTFNVPLIIHLPDQRKGRTVSQVGGQIDILPTVANIMGITLKDEGFTAFGHDLLNIDHNLIGMRYYLPTGTFINDDVLFIPGKKGFEDGTATSIETLKPVQVKEWYKAEYQFIKQWIKLSDRFLKNQQTP